jgi:hypothetical protein
MRKALVVPVLLGVMWAGCKMMEPQPNSTTGSTGALAVPTAPPLQTVPDIGGLPTLPPSSHIVVTIYPRAGKYLAAGVDRRERRFSFALVGSRATLNAMLERFYATRVPVTVYTAPLVLEGSAQTPPPNPLVPAPAPAVSLPSTEPTRTDGGVGGTQCENCIGDDQGGGERNPGGDDGFRIFLRLAWDVSSKLEPVARPGPMSTGTVGP